jgi:hypothetical protein
MTAPHADQLIDGYLARLRAAASELPRAARDELMADVESHIAEARSRDSNETDAAILNILDRIGEPTAVVGEARERLGVPAEAPYRSGFLEIAALVLVPLLWPVGVILLWTSAAWKVRDKLIGSLLPPGGFLGIILVGMMGTTHGGGGCVMMTNDAGQVISNTCTQYGAPTWLLDILGILLPLVFFVLPFVTAAYLAYRLHWGRQLRSAAA